VVNKKQSERLGGGGEGGAQFTTPPKRGVTTKEETERAVGLALGKLEGEGEGAEVEFP